MDENQANMIAEILVSELQATAPKNVRILGTADLNAMIEQDRARDAANCEDTDCLLELSGAMGSSHILQVSLGHFAEQYVINAKLIANQEAAVLYRKVVYVKFNQKDLLDGVRVVARDLGPRLKAPARDATATAELSEQNSGPKAPAAEPDKARQNPPSAPATVRLKPPKNQVPAQQTKKPKEQRPNQQIYDSTKYANDNSDLASESGSAFYWPMGLAAMGLCTSCGGSSATFVLILLLINQEIYPMTETERTYMGYAGLAGLGVAGLGLAMLTGGVAWAVLQGNE